MNAIQSEYLIVKSGTEQWKYSNFYWYIMELLDKTVENFYSKRGIGKMAF